MAQRGTEITPDQVVGFALTQASSSPLGGISLQSGTSVSGAGSQTGQLLVFTSSSPSTYLLPATVGSLWTTTVVAGGTGTLTLSPPSGTTLNGSTDPITIPAGGGAILYSDGAGNFRAIFTSSSAVTASTTHTEILTDSNGPITTSTGDFIYVAGVPN